MTVGKLAPRIGIDCAGRSDAGRERDENQDQFLIGRLSRALRVDGSSLGGELGSPLLGRRRGTLLLVADGVGGVEGGARASALAVQSVVSRLADLAPLEEGGDAGAGRFQRGLLRAVRRARERILEEAGQSRARQGMGTTLTLAYLRWPRLHLLHVGDSRCYLLRGERLSRLTRDHTIARRLVEEGVIDAADEARSPYSSVLWNAINGRETKLEPELQTLDLEPGDALLLCTDGLTRHVDDAGILACLQAHADDAAQACEALIGAANADGGSDNVTVIVARLRGAPPAHQSTGST